MSRKWVPSKIFTQRRRGAQEQTEPEEKEQDQQRVPGTSIPPFPDPRLFASLCAFAPWRETHASHPNTHPERNVCCVSPQGWRTMQSRRIPPSTVKVGSRGVKGLQFCPGGTAIPRGSRSRRHEEEGIRRS